MDCRQAAASETENWNASFVKVNSSSCTTKQQPMHEALRCDERSVGIGRGSSTILIDLGCKIVRSFPPLRVTCSKDMSVIMMQSERGGAWAWVWRGRRWSCQMPVVIGSCIVVKQLRRKQRTGMHHSSKFTAAQHNQAASVARGSAVRREKRRNWKGQQHDPH